MTNPLKLGKQQPRSGFLTPMLRELRPIEHGLLQDHLLRLSPESRILRFGCPVSSMFIETYCQNKGRPKPIIFGALIGETLCGVVELRFGEKIPQDVAELGISVEDDWQDTGIGTKLMEIALRCARDNGIAVLEVNFLPHNTAMRRLTQKFGANFSYQMGMTKAIIALPRPSYAVVAGSKRPQ